MTSFKNFPQSLAAHLPSTSNSGEGSNHGTNEQEDSLAMSHIICNLIDNIRTPANLQAVQSTSSNIPYDIWAVSAGSSAQNLGGPSIREFNTNNNNQSKEENLSGSPGTSSSISFPCFRCEERAPNTRCLECNDIFCYECCYKVTSECQLREHTLLPMHQISPIGARCTSSMNEKENVLCELHGDALRYYCDSCTVFICQECTLWLHKDHIHTQIKGALNLCRIGVFRAIEDTKVGTKAIKTAIDRTVAVTKAYEKEVGDASMKIKKAMRCFVQEIEAREKYLLDKVEQMRHNKVSELEDQMNTLRGILSGLSHTNEALLKSMDYEGIDLFMAKERGKAEIEYYSCMFKSMHLVEERIMFVPPNYDLVDQFKRQCDVYSTPTPNAMHAQSSTANQSRQSLAQSLQSALTYPSLTYQVPVTSTLRLPEYTNQTRSTSTYENTAISLPVDTNPPRAVGQSISGYWKHISLKPCRNPVPSVPILSFSREGAMDGQVSRPWGVCIDCDGNILVADRRNNRIQIFNNRGEFQSKFGSKGPGPGEFELPAGITTDNFRRIIVVDKDNHRVQIFTSAGVFISKFGSFGKECGQFQYPWDVAVNNLGNILVSDTRNHRIQLFTSDGTFITKMGFEGPNPAKMLKGTTSPRGVCFTVTGHIIVSDFENHRLLLIDATLTKILHSACREGPAPGELCRPSGIVTDDEGRIIVADAKNHRVCVFSPQLTLLCILDARSPGLDDKDRPCDVALTREGYLVIAFETLPDTARDLSQEKEYIKVY